MSAYQTLYITRAKALEIWTQEKMYSPNNEELEQFLNNYVKRGLNNCRIIDDWDEQFNDDALV